MQRIKSQSTCQASGHSLANQHRPRSKKAVKGQSSDQIGHNIDRSKHSIPVISQNSLVSIRASSRPISGSMKNLKTINNQQNTTKNSIQNTSRALNNNQSSNNISARILKQIVGYSHRGGSKPKSTNKDGNHEQNKQDNTIKIDLTEEVENFGEVIDKQDQQPRTTLSGHRNRSYNHSSHNHDQNGNSSNQKAGNKNKINYIVQHRVVQEFSPMTSSPSKNKLSFDQNTKKYSFFNSNTEQLIKISARKINNKIQQKQKQKPKTNYDTHMNYSSFNDIEKDSQQNRFQLSNHFIKVTSPHNLLSSLDKSGISKVSEVPFSGLFAKENMKNLSNSLMSQSNVGQRRNLLYDVDECRMSQTEMEEQKQKLIICLQNSTTILEQLVDYKFKQLVHCWKGIIEEQAKLNKITLHIKQLSEELSNKQKQDMLKKTELFQLNRDQICRKKQKQYVTRSNRDKYIQEAVCCQQALKLKLSSKADYEHVILFNQRVILTGKNPTQDLYNMFVEMFEGKLTKKFGLIAKKQLSNLSVYDSRLIQDFLKRIQQLQSFYTRMQPHQSQQSHHYISSDQQQKLEQLVQQIQQLTLQQQNIKSNISERQQQLQQIEARITEIKDSIAEYIRKMNNKVSSQYRMAEGQSYDFQALLRKKCEKEFESYRMEVKYRDDLLEKLDKLERAMGISRTKKQSCHILPSDQQHSKQTKRKSISFVSTPDQSPYRHEKQGSREKSRSNVFKKPKIQL